MRLGISTKLLIFIFCFVLIFYGTVVGLFIKVRQMSAISAGIVSVNNHIASLSKNLLDNLVEMDANEKKFRLLKKQLYFEGFETARLAYNRDLNRILNLVPRDHGIWQNISATYAEFARSHSQAFFLDEEKSWASEEQISGWIRDISRARQDNERHIEQALLNINEQTRAIVKNGTIGFGISIIVGLLGVLFISRSMISPLNKLKTGFGKVSRDNYSHQIHIATNDEFEDLARAFNEMNRQLKADEEIRSDFIASLSHEIRTPLSSVRESVNMIVEGVLGPVNPKQQKFLKIAAREISRLTTLLNHLLDTSKLETEHEKPLFEPMDPDALIKEAVQALEPAAEFRAVALSYTPLPHPPKVVGEKKEILQVLLNIMGNALKFAPENGRVEAGLEPCPQNEFLSFFICDDGPGIPEEKQELIFKKYYRAQEIRETLDGVGLGLNIARRIIRDHGGRISVRNNTGKGCTFTFTLPVYKGNISP